MLIDGVSWHIALVISITMIFTILFAKLVGCILPVFAKLIKFDPAVMASPFITTIVDAISLMIYFRIDTLFLKL